MPTYLYHLPDGRTLSPGVPFTLSVRMDNNVNDDIRFPPNFLELATNAELQRFGITSELVPDPVAPVPTQAELVATADDKIVAIQEAGVTVNGVAITTTQKGLTLLNGAVSRAGKNPLAVCNWVISPGNKFDLDAETVSTLGLAVGDWINAGYAALDAVYDAILAGTITTHEQVNDPARWPSSVI